MNIKISVRTVQASQQKKKLKAKSIFFANSAFKQKAQVASLIPTLCRHEQMHSVSQSTATKKSATCKKTTFTSKKKKLCFYTIPKV